MSNGVQTTGNIAITDSEFAQFQRFIFQLAGISLANTKKMLLTGRLSRRLHHFGFSTFTRYFRHVMAGRNRKELQTIIDLLTTNETYFFREPAHFDFLASLARLVRADRSPAHHDRDGRRRSKRIEGNARYRRPHGGRGRIHLRGLWHT